MWGLSLWMACARAALVVTDDLGRKVTLTDHPHRVVALVPSVADILFALGHGGDVAGVSEFTKYPQAAKTKPHVGLPLSPNLETILSLHPDLVIGIADLNSGETIGKLEHLHLPLLMVNGSSVANIYTSIRTIGNALDDPAAAAALDSKLQARALRVMAERKNKVRPTVLLPIWSDPLIVAGKHAFVTELITMAGADSVTADVAEDWTQISIEAVVNKQPQLLILPGAWQTTMTQLSKQAGWKDLECVQHKRVVRVDDRLELPSPVAFDAMEELAKQFDKWDGEEAGR
jgi:iron complex transport system substrate-binding protein